MFRSVTRVVRRRGCLAGAALTLAAVAAAARLLSPPSLSAVAEFPRVRPADLAHLLADVSTHTLIPTPWTLEEEAGNYTSWRYVVSYSCGARCAGRAAVLAHEEHAPERALQHAREHVLAHRVLVRRERCRTLPLLPWPQLCDEIETEWVVTGLGPSSEGARLSETARAFCGGLAAALAQCPGADDLAAARDTQLRKLRDLLHTRRTRAS